MNAQVRTGDLSGLKGSVAVSFLDDVFVDLPCPCCGYAIDVQLADIRLQGRVFCPCCKQAIQLVDADASNEVGARQIDAALRSLGFES